MIAGKSTKVSDHVDVEPYTFISTLNGFRSKDEIERSIERENEDNYESSFILDGSNFSNLNNHDDNNNSFNVIKKKTNPKRNLGNNNIAAGRSTQSSDHVDFIPLVATLNGLRSLPPPLPTPLISASINPNKINNIAAGKHTPLSLHVGNLPFIASLNGLASLEEIESSVISELNNSKSFATPQKLNKSIISNANKTVAGTPSKGSDHLDSLLGWKGIEGQSTYNENFHPFVSDTQNVKLGNRDVLDSNNMRELLNWNYSLSDDDDKNKSINDNIIKNLNTIDNVKGNSKTSIITAAGRTNNSKSSAWTVDLDVSSNKSPSPSKKYKSKLSQFVNNENVEITTNKEEEEVAKALFLRRMERKGEIEKMKENFHNNTKIHGQDDKFFPVFEVFAPPHPPPKKHSKKRNDAKDSDRGVEDEKQHYYDIRESAEDKRLSPTIMRVKTPVKSSSLRGTPIQRVITPSERGNISTEIRNTLVERGRTPLSSSPRSLGEGKEEEEEEEEVEEFNEEEDELVIVDDDDTPVKRQRKHKFLSPLSDTHNHRENKMSSKKSSPLSVEDDEELVGLFPHVTLQHVPSLNEKSLLKKLSKNNHMDNKGEERAEREDKHPRREREKKDRRKKASKSPSSFSSSSFSSSYYERRKRRKRREKNRDRKKRKKKRYDSSSSVSSSYSEDSDDDESEGERSKHTQKNRDPRDNRKGDKEKKGKKKREERNEEKEGENSERGRKRGIFTDSSLSFNYYEEDEEVLDTELKIDYNISSDMKYSPLEDRYNSSNKYLYEAFKDKLKRERSSDENTYSNNTNNDNIISTKRPTSPVIPLSVTSKVRLASSRIASLIEEFNNKANLSLQQSLNNSNLVNSFSHTKPLSNTEEVDEEDEQVENFGDTKALLDVNVINPLFSSFANKKKSTINKSKNTFNIMNTTAASGSSLSKKEQRIMRDIQNVFQHEHNVLNIGINDDDDEEEDGGEENEDGYEIEYKEEKGEKLLNVYHTNFDKPFSLDITSKRKSNLDEIFLKRDNEKQSDGNIVSEVEEKSLENSTKGVKKKIEDKEMLQFNEDGNDVEEMEEIEEGEEDLNASILKVLSPHYSPTNASTDNKIISLAEVEKKEMALLIDVSDLMRENEVLRNSANEKQENNNSITINKLLKKNEIRKNNNLYDGNKNTSNIALSLSLLNDTDNNIDDVEENIHGNKKENVVEELSEEIVIQKIEKQVKPKEGKSMTINENNEGKDKNNEEFERRDREIQLLLLQNEQLKLLLGSNINNNNNSNDNNKKEREIHYIPYKKSNFKKKRERRMQPILFSDKNDRDESKNTINDGIEERGNVIIIKKEKSSTKINMLGNSDDIFKKEQLIASPTDANNNSTNNNTFGSKNRESEWNNNNRENDMNKSSNSYLDDSEYLISKRMKKDNISISNNVNTSTNSLFHSLNDHVKRRVLTTSQEVRDRMDKLYSNNDYRREKAIKNTDNEKKMLNNNNNVSPSSSLVFASNYDINRNDELKLTAFELNTKLNPPLLISKNYSNVSKPPLVNFSAIKSVLLKNFNQSNPTIPARYSPSASPPYSLSSSLQVPHGVEEGTGGQQNTAGPKVAHSLHIKQDGEILIHSPATRSSKANTITLKKTGSIFIESEKFGKNVATVDKVEKNYQGLLDDNSSNKIHLKRSGSIVYSLKDKLTDKEKVLSSSTAMVLSPKSVKRSVFSDNESDYGGSVRYFDEGDIFPSSSPSSPAFLKRSDLDRGETGHTPKRNIKT